MSPRANPRTGGVGIECPRCGRNDTRVIDTRYRRKRPGIARRRRCGCGARFSTEETVTMETYTPGPAIVYTTQDGIFIDRGNGPRQMGRKL